jgi:hypothetical protein
MGRLTGDEPQEKDFRSAFSNNHLLKKVPSDVGRLAKDVPSYVREPPIEAVVFGWGVAEDGQLVSVWSTSITKSKFCILGCALNGLVSGKASNGVDCE